MISPIDFSAYETISPLNFSCNFGSFFRYDDISENMEELQVDGVRIIPAVSVFDDAFEGRNYKQKLQIQNCGEKSAFIRIGPPSSSAIKINTLVRGQALSPGLSITRTIKYTYMSGSAVPLSTIPIYINEEPLEYKIYVHLSSSIISIEPMLLDFGLIDTKPCTKSLELTLKNDGTKESRYAIDLGTNEMGLVVKPMRGCVGARSNIKLTVSLMGVLEGVHFQEIWIKCEKPIRVQVTVTVYAPSLEVFGCNCTKDFALIDFTRTYFGIEQKKRFVIKNNSNSSILFCALAEVKDKRMEFNEAVEERFDFQCFSISPLEGNMCAQQGEVFEITFRPKRYPKGHRAEHSDDYFLCFLKIFQSPYKDIGTRDIYGERIIDTKDTESINISIGRKSLLSDRSLASSLNEVSIDSSICHNVIYSEDNRFTLRNNLRICLHGLCEKASIQIQPDALTLYDVAVNKTVYRVLCLKNLSSHLPITFRYKKMANVDIVPNMRLLKPSESYEVAVHITPKGVGTIETKISFDLLYRSDTEEEYINLGSEYINFFLSVPSTTITKTPSTRFNMGITPKNVHEVGFLTDDVKFGTKIQKPKAAVLKYNTKLHPDDLMAFPNDRARSLRPWKNPNKCTTIFARLPRPDTTDETYELTQSEFKLKIMNDTYYLHYTRQEAMKLRKGVTKCSRPSSVSDLSKKEIFLKARPMTVSCPYPCQKEERFAPSFIALSPTQLYRIQITPIHLHLGRITLSSVNVAYVIVKNDNNVDIKMFCKSNKSHIMFPLGQRHRINRNTSVQIPIQYRAMELGRIFDLIELIINDNHLFELPVSSNVVPKHLKLKVHEVLFQSNEDNLKFIEIINPCNVAIDFNWVVPRSCFNVKPKVGTIEGNGICKCTFFYMPHPTAPSTTDFILIADNGSNETIKVAVNCIKPKIQFQYPTLNIDNIPLNLEIEKKFFIRNNSSEMVSFCVTSGELMRGVTIQPSSGVLKGKSDTIFTLYLQIKACIDFSFDIEFEMQRLYKFDLKVYGTVSYPKVIVRPETLIFRKILLDSYDRLAFLVENESDSMVKVQFDFDAAPDFFVAESHAIPVEELSPDGFFLNPEEKKTLYMNFAPVDVAAYSFYMPIILNGMIGPPDTMRIDSINPAKYISDEERHYVENNKAKPIPVPDKLPLVKISGSVSGATLKFSSLSFNFLYFPYADWVNTYENEGTLVITNKGQDEIVFCIRLDDLFGPFDMELESGNNIQKHPKSYLCVLNAAESVVFKLYFKPDMPGSYTLKLPIYVRNYLQGSPFNYLQIFGEYPFPSTCIKDPIVLLQPVPPEIKAQKTIEIEKTFHLPDCQMQSICDANNINVVFQSQEKENEYEKMLVTFQYQTNFIGSLDICITLTCSCKAYCDIFLRCFTENCLATAHSFIHTSYLNTIPEVFPPVINYLDFFAISNCKVSSGTSVSKMSQNRYRSVFDVCVLEDAESSENDFPLFPEDSDKSDYADHMRYTLKSVEKWVFEQGFYQMKYFSIPQGIAAYPRPVISGEKEKKVAHDVEDEFVPTYVQLLTNLVGQSIQSTIIKRTIPKDHLERIAFIYSIYNRTIELLKQENMNLGHVYPEHLLEYEDYVDFMKYIFSQHITLPNNTTPEIMTEEMFIRRAKQSWMDMVLQIFKTFVLKRVITTHSDVNYDIFISIFSQSEANLLPFSKVFQSFDNIEINIYNKAEIKLLAWLDYHFLIHYAELFGENPEIRQKHIQLFDADLQNSLVLATVTYAFCPYFKDNFKKMHVSPISYEEYYFNACCLVEAWKKIHLSFKILPNEIVRPNLVNMLMLVTYLYLILPTLFPKETITFVTNHSQMDTKVITIENKSSAKVCYVIEVFGKNVELFNVQPKILHINPNKEGTLQISFFAKKLQRVHCVLLLCGDTPGNVYGKSMGFILEGIPDLSFFYHQIDINCNLYDIMPMKRTLQSPYELGATYELFTTFDAPEHIDTLQLTSWEVLKQHKLPRRLYTQSTKIETNSEGVGEMDLVVCALVPLRRKFYTYFVSPSVGAFGCQLDINVLRTRTNYEEIFVQLPRDFTENICCCSKKGSPSIPGIKCPRYVNVDIPTKNNIMWACLEKIFFLMMADIDQEFWIQHIGTPTGMHIMEYILECERAISSRDIQHIFNKTVTYNVVYDKAPSAFFQPTITIQNVVKSGVVTVPMHVEKDKPTDFYINLESEDGNEIRYYQIKFKS